MSQMILNYLSKKEEVLLPSAARTAAVNSSDISTPYAKGIMLFLNVSAVTLTPGLTLSVEMKDPVSGLYSAIWTAAAAVTTVSKSLYILYPGAKDGNAIEVDGIPIPKTWRLSVAVADADSATYSVSYSTLN